MSQRTLVLGLDGATFSILDPLARRGIMPFIQHLMEHGVRAPLHSITPALTPPAWVSIMTGCSPGIHGVFDFFQKEQDGRHIRVTTFDDIRKETLWAMAERNGCRVTTLNFPVMFPPPNLKGNVVAGGWLTWRQLRFACAPRELLDRFKAIDGFDPRKLALEMAHERRAIEGCALDEYEHWIDFHLERECQWFRVTDHLMETDPCELTAVVFDGVDKIQHLCWPYIKAAVDRVDLEPREARIRDRCLDYFRTLDTIMERLADRLGQDGTVIVVSDHGFGEQRETFFVNAWLESQGYLAWADDRPPREGESETLGMGQLARHVHLLDWSRTKAYAATPSSNGIHIVRAEENGGAGVFENEYESFREELIRGLASLRSPSTGRPLFNRIWRREEVFQGPFSHLGPDITLDLWDGGLISILASDAHVKVRETPAGAHRYEGVFLAAGPGIFEGRVCEALSVIDVTPTVLHSLGLAVPEDLEGKVARSIFRGEFLEDHPVVRKGRSVRRIGEAVPRAPVETKEDEAKMVAHLQALGYF